MSKANMIANYIHTDLRVNHDDMTLDHVLRAVMALKISGTVTNTAGLVDDVRDHLKGIETYDLPRDMPNSKLSQPELFKILTSDYKTINRWPEGRNWDYLILMKIDGIEYWYPNDESWGSIIAVDRTHKLATFTGFYDTDDFTSPDSDYRYQYDSEDNRIKCAYKIEKQ